MKHILIIAILVALCGCAERDWVTGQRERCRAMGGYGSYADGLFECWRGNRPFSFKIEFNKPVDFPNTPAPVKIFEARYRG